MTNNKNICQIYSAYDGFMTVWDAKLSEEASMSAQTSFQLPNRVRPVFKVINLKELGLELHNIDRALLDVPNRQR